MQALFVFVAMTCGPSPKDLQAAAVRYADAIDEVKHGAASVGLDKLRATVRRFPWFSLAHLAIAQTEDKRGAWINAFVAYRRYQATDTHPDDRPMVEERIDALVQKSKPLALFVEGERAAERQHWPRAIQLLEQVIEQKPNFPLAYQLLGKARAAQRDFGMAIAAYRNYLDADKTAPDAAAVEALIDQFERQARAP